MQLWKGRFKKELSKTTNDFNSSIPFDSRMYREDIEGSIAHATMLGRCGIISEESSADIIEGLRGILADIESGALKIDMEAEDIHTFIEGELTKRIGDNGKRLHTSRSRNDQVALDVKLYLKKEVAAVKKLVVALIKVIADKAAQYSETVMPGYTHLQRAQPIVFGHHLLAYGEMLLRDVSRLEDCLRRMDEMPLGSCALAGTTYPIDRTITAELLGFDRITNNSLDGVSDRDFCIEFASVLSIIMVHLSRFSEEIIMWCSWEFKFVELDDAFSTGSSIMPQKKNPDIAELVRGKSGRVFGDTMTLLTVMKGIALAYNKDMQEDKEAIFDAVDTVKMCLTAFTPMLDTMRVIPENMRKAAAGGFINATDCADWLTKNGVPFRDAYKATGELVARCIELGTDLENLPLAEYKAVCDVFTEDVYNAISLEKCVSQRTAFGGPAPQLVKAQAQRVREIAENVGATGYAGAELVRLLSAHPEAEIAAVSSVSFEGQKLSDVYPAYAFLNDMICENQAAVVEKSDVIFAALPHGLSQELAAQCMAAGKAFIDLGADFRLKSEDAYTEWYGGTFLDKELHAQSVYGLPEFFRDKIKGKRLIANPGCYTTCSPLAIAPAIVNGLVSTKGIICDCKSGVTGAGRKPTQGNHFPELNEGFHAYKVACHRHTPEIEQTLSKLSGEDVTITFVPHLLPVNRGILATVYADVKDGVTFADIRKAYEDYYKDEFFVRLLPDGKCADIHNVRYSNFCDISIHHDARAGKLVACAAIDNMVKGAAGQAIQNMNIIFGLDETTGLIIVPPAF